MARGQKPKTTSRQPQVRYQARRTFRYYHSFIPDHVPTSTPFLLENSPCLPRFSPISIQRKRNPRPELPFPSAHADCRRRRIQDRKDSTPPRNPVLRFLPDPMERIHSRRRFLGSGTEPETFQVRPRRL